MERAAVLHTIICCQVNKVQADYSVKTASFLVWEPTWKGGPSWLCRAANESLFAVETFLITRPSRKTWCVIEILNCPLLNLTQIKDYMNSLIVPPHALWSEWEVGGLNYTNT